jgi:hypothetical protein
LGIYRAAPRVSRALGADGEDAVQGRVEAIRRPALQGGGGHGAEALASPPLCPHGVRHGEEAREEGR